MTVTDSSGAEKPASRVERADLLMAAWDGVSRKIADLYSAKSLVAGARDITVLPVANDDNLEAALQRKGQELQLPIIGVTPSNVEPNDGSYNRTVMRKHGDAITYSKDGAYWVVAKVAPYVMTVAVTMVSDDVVTAFRMIDRWLANERWLFVLRYDDYAVKIKCVPDKNIAFPKPAPNAGGSEQYRVQTNLRVETYAGYIWRVPTVKKAELSVGIIKKPVPANPSELEAFLLDPANTVVDMSAVIDVNPNGEPS